MGSSASSASHGADGAAGGAPTRPSAEAVNNFLQYLRQRGRYFALQRPDGKVVHILGVVPGSQASCREAKNLLIALRPGTVYVDTAVGRVSTLRKHVKLGGPPRPKAPPSADLRLDYGMAMSTMLHKLDCEAGVFRMVGVDPDEVWRESVGQADSMGARVLAWPAHFDKAYNNQVLAFDRFGQVGFDVYGNQGFWSTQAFLVASVEMTSIKILDGVNSDLGRVTIPPSGYFSTTAIEGMSRANRQAFDTFAKKNSAQSLDFETHFAGHIRDFRERIARGGPAVADGTVTDMSSVADRLEVPEAQASLAQMEMARDFFAVQVQTLAGVLVGDDELALADAAKERGDDAGSPFPTAPVRAPTEPLSQDETVALVELPRVAGLLRAWDSPMPVKEGLVERDLGGFAVQIGSPLALAGGLGYAYHRLLIRRFPRAATGVAVVVGGIGAAVYTMSMYVGGYAPIGVGMWQALSSPVAPVGSNLGLGSGGRPSQ